MAGKVRGSKASADKNTFNPQQTGKENESQTRGKNEQDPKRRIGNFQRAGDHARQQ